MMGPDLVKVMATSLSSAYSEGQRKELDCQLNLVRIDEVRSPKWGTWRDGTGNCLLLGAKNIPDK